MFKKTLIILLITISLNTYSQEIAKCYTTELIESELITNPDYKDEIKKAIYNSKLKLFKNYIYDSNPTKLTNQIEKITNYKKRKKNLVDEITRLEKSDEINKERLI